MYLYTFRKQFTKRVINLNNLEYFYCMKFFQYFFLFKNFYYIYMYFFFFRVKAVKFCFLTGYNKSVNKFFKLNRSFLKQQFNFINFSGIRKGIW